MRLIFGGLVKRLLTVLFCSIFLYLPYRQLHAIVDNENNTAYAVPVEGITIDGDISDWPDNMIRWPILDDTHTRGDTDLDFEDLHTSGDYSCSFMIGYNLDENLLYVAVIAQDDLEYAKNIDSWNTDACELYLDAPHRERRHIWAKYDAEYLSSNQYILCPPGGGYGLGISTVNPRQPNFTLTGGDVRKTKSRAAYGRRTTQTVYEFALDPLEQYPDASMKLEVGDTLGFDLAMVDRDTVSDNTAFITWGPISKRQDVECGLLRRCGPH